MVHRKAEPPAEAIGCGCPHRVALSQQLCMGHLYRTVRYFCAAEKLSLFTHEHSFEKSGQWFQVFCFAEAAHAERFRARFGGEMIGPPFQSQSPAGA